MTGKQKAFADLILNNPTMPASAAVKQVYDVSTDGSARMIASENLTKPSIQAYMTEHASLASNKIIQLVSSSREDIALRASQDVLDRTYGKAKQSVDIQSTSVNIDIKLS